MTPTAEYPASFSENDMQRIKQRYLFVALRRREEAILGRPLTPAEQTKLKALTC